MKWIKKADYQYDNGKKKQSCWEVTDGHSTATFTTTEMNRLVKEFTIQKRKRSYETT